MNKLTINKKHRLLPVILILAATMLMTPMANARITTANVSEVVSSYGVTDPDNVIKSDGKFAIFDGAGSMLVGKWTVNAPPLRRKNMDICKSIFRKTRSCKLLWFFWYRTLDKRRI